MSFSVWPLRLRFRDIDPRAKFSAATERIRSDQGIAVSQHWSISRRPFSGSRGSPSQPNVYYYGATGGGVWKTTDGGINWEPVSDGSVFGTGSVGAIAVV